MEQDNTRNEDTRDVPTRERDPAQPPKPRGNQEPRREWVEQGEEQLDKVSGN
jgi:hypothetical protein